MIKLRDVKPVKGTLHKQATPAGIEVSIHLKGDDLPSRTSTTSKKRLRGAISLPVQLKIGKKKYESTLLIDPNSPPYLSIGGEPHSPDDGKIHKALKHFDLSRTVTMRMRLKLKKAAPRKRKKAAEKE